MSGAWTIIAVSTSLAAAAPATGIYLPSSETGGGEYLFNPASRELREVLKKPAPRPGDLLDARALADDLGFLRRALRKQYIGYPELLQVPDFDVEALFDEHITRLRNGPPRVTFRDSALALFRTLKGQINDRHFGLFGADADPREEYREYQLALEGAPPSLEGCSAPEMAASTLAVAAVAKPAGKPGQLVTVSARPRGDTLELTCGKTHHRLDGRPPAPREDGQDEKPTYEWRRAGQAAIIRIRRFRGNPAERARLDQLAADYPEHRRSPVLVFDLRGNGGGDDGYAYRWVEKAKRGRWDAQTWSVYPTGSFRPWLVWNNHVWDGIAQDRIDDPPAITEREKIRQQWPRRSSELFVRFQPHQIDGQAAAPYQGRIFVLVDRGCGSSGESAALMLRHALGAKLVGERTAGFAEYGNQRRLVLPRTHLVLFFATKRNYFTTPVESVGMPVDVYLPPALMGAPVDELLPILRRLPR